MKLLRLNGTMALSIAGALALIGCSDDDSSNDPGGPVDTGIPDTSTNNNNSGGMDGSIFVPDSGLPDAVVIDTGPAPDLCPDGTEGCECVSTIGPQDPALLQDDCETGLLCVPWDIISQNQALTGPVQACARPCTVDADCGTNDDGSQRECVPTGLTPESGLEFQCVDRISGIDEWCGLSRLTVQRDPDAPIRTGSEMVGCPDGTPCTQNFFTDVHVAEGICMTVCDEQSDCAEPTPYCNPGLFGNGTIGVCSESRRGVGSLCGPQNADKLGITTRCDTSTAAPSNLTCLPGTNGIVGFELPGNQGICAAICNDDLPCDGTDPVLGPTTCSNDLYLANNDGVQFGVCGAGCTAFPENCGGSGELGAGRFCGGVGGDGTDFCIDIVPPTLTPGEIVNGMIDFEAGDNCAAPNSTSVLSCPIGSFCIENVNGTRGACFFGCSRAADADPAICDTYLGTTSSTCAFVLNTELPIGLCSLEQ